MHSCDTCDMYKSKVRHIHYPVLLSQVFRWYSQFRDGRELVEDNKRDGIPKSTLNEVNIAVVLDLVKNDYQIASRMIAESLNIPKTVVPRILKEDLGKEKVVCTFCSTLLDT